LTASKKNLVPYIFIELSNIFGVIAGSMVFIALPWLALELTKSAASAGTLIAISAIPGLFIFPLLGTIIDRIGRRISAALSEFLSAIAILAIPLFYLFFGMSFSALVLLAVLRGVVNPASGTARKSLIPDVAKPAGISLERANSIHEAVFATGFAIGPALGALFIAFIGPYNVFIVVAVFSLVAALFAYLVKVVESRGDGKSETGSLIKDTVLGLKTIWNTRAVRLGMGFVMTLALIYLPTELVVLPAHFNLLEFAAGLGILISTMAGASVLGALLFETLQARLKYSSILKLGFIGIGTTVLLMSLLPPFWVMLVLGAILGFSWGPLMPMLNTVIQRIVPDQMRGRVFSIEMTIWGAGPMLTTVIVGMGVDSFGVPPIYLILALIVLGLSVFISFNRANSYLDDAQKLAPAT
jgi:MFS family permease